MNQHFRQQVLVVGKLDSNGVLSVTPPKFTHDITDRDVFHFQDQPAHVYRIAGNGDRPSQLYLCDREYDAADMAEMEADLAQTHQASSWYGQ